MLNHFTVKDEQIQHFKVRTLIMAAKDDPMVSYHRLPMEGIKKNPHVKLIATEKGGHLGWFSGMRPKKWYP